MRPVVLALAIAIAITTTACGGGTPASTLPRGSEAFEVDPADFTTEIDNPYWPMAPGSHWVYRETDADGDVQRNDVIVTNQTKTIMGIEAVVVHDTVRQGGQLTEDTYDW
jgi:hypothetical protein